MVSRSVVQRGVGRRTDGSFYFFLEPPDKFSYLVKKVDDLFLRVQGSMYLTVLDLNKAYKNLSCSKKVMQYTPFRVLSSTKYGHLTFSFLSSMEGCAVTPDYDKYPLKTNTLVQPCWLGL